MRHCRKRCRSPSTWAVSAPSRIASSRGYSRTQPATIRRSFRCPRENETESRPPHCRAPPVRHLRNWPRRRPPSAVSDSSAGLLFTNAGTSVCRFERSQQAVVTASSDPNQAAAASAPVHRQTAGSAAPAAPVNVRPRLLLCHERDGGLYMGATPMATSASCGLTHCERSDSREGVAKRGVLSVACGTLRS